MRRGDRRSTWTLATVRLGVGFLIALLLLSLWSLIAATLPPAILPGPASVWMRFLAAWSDGTYVAALGTTAGEVILGWGAGVVIAVPLGYLLGRVQSLEDTLAPYLAGSQAMPIVAIAPLLVVWVGFGLLPKVIVCALIVFFPILATTAAGIRGVPSEVRDAARVFGAGWWPLAIHVDLPLAARSIFAGLKVSAALSVTGAVVGEFVSSEQGLGYLIMLGRTNFDTPLMFVGLLSLILLGAACYVAVSLVERSVIRWET